MQGIAIKRVYDAPTAEDGLRVLIDRLWPRGLSRERAGVDLWLREAAPSHALRKAYHGGLLDAPAFAAAYRAELASLPAAAAAVGSLRQVAAGRRVTLLYAARDDAPTNAHVLRDWLLDPQG